MNLFVPDSHNLSIRGQVILTLDFDLYFLLLDFLAEEILLLFLSLFQLLEWLIH